MLEVRANRSHRKYSSREMFLRIGWGVAKWLFRISPRPCFGFRASLLRLFGAKVGERVHIYPSAVIYFPWTITVGNESAIGEDALVYSLGAITIGERVTISQRSHLCAGTHDYTRRDMQLVRLPITINDDAWICADAFVGPGVVIHRGAVVGARAAVFRDVDAWTVVGGNPARFIKQRILRD